MSEGIGNFPSEALEDIAYLARSTNRAVILDALTSGSFSRKELGNETGVARTTLDRIVNELEERGWAERTAAGTYTTTAHGTHLMRRFRPFIESVEALHELEEAITWLPIEELSIELRHFSDADVRRPAADDPVEAIEFMTDLLRNVSEFRVLAHLAPPEPFAETMHDRVASGQLSMDGVITDEVYDYIRTRPERSDRWRTLLEANADVHRVDGPIPCNLWVFDETVLIKKSGPGPIDESYGVPIVSEDDTVRSWANELIDQWLETGSRIGVDSFSEGISGTSIE